ncbi:hypothetical protein M1513_01105 [Patescibacteria group bacterium]|nr:hypothetical protein [Patescibacteria group bacterium]
MKNKKSRNAYITRSVTDQGNGGANCSSCHYPLDDYLEEWMEKIVKDPKEISKGLKGKTKAKKRKTVADPGELKCPNCGAKLEDGGVYISAGGSDF